MERFAGRASAHSPTRSIEASITEMQWAKDHGAVGVFFRGIEGNRTLDDPYFFPVYQEAERLDLPELRAIAAEKRSFAG